MNNHWNNPDPHIYFCDDRSSYFYLRWVFVGELTKNELGQPSRKIQSFDTKEKAEQALSSLQNLLYSDIYV